MEQRILISILQLTRRLLRNVDLDFALQLVVDTALEMLPGNHASIRVLDPTGTRLLTGARSGVGSTTSAMSFDAGEGVLGWVVRHELVAYIDDASRDLRFAKREDQGFDIGSMIAVPLFWDERVLGVLGITSAGVDGFSRQQTMVAEILANCASPAIERARLERLAITDELTMTFNRRYLFDRLEEEIERALRNGKHLTLVSIDLDNFKQVNDQRGHPAGDRVLQEVSARIRSCIRLSDVIIRRGGDEFIVIMPDFDAAQGEGAVRRLIMAVGDAPIMLADETEIAQTISAGMAHWDGKESAREMEQRADGALYVAKSNGKNTVAMADESDGAERTSYY